MATDGRLSSRRTLDVMAGLDPAIHANAAGVRVGTGALLLIHVAFAWMGGSSPPMTVAGGVSGALSAATRHSVLYLRRHPFLGLSTFCLGGITPFLKMKQP